MAESRSLPGERRRFERTGQQRLVPQNALRRNPPELPQVEQVRFAQVPVANLLDSAARLDLHETVRIADEASFRENRSAPIGPGPGRFVRQSCRRILRLVAVRPHQRRRGLGRSQVQRDLSKRPGASELGDGVAATKMVFHRLVDGRAVIVENVRRKRRFVGFIGRFGSDRRAFGDTASGAPRRNDGSSSTPPGAPAVVDIVACDENRLLGRLSLGVNHGAATFAGVSDGGADLTAKGILFGRVRDGTDSLGIAEGVAEGIVRIRRLHSPRRRSGAGRSAASLAPRRRAGAAEKRAVRGSRNPAPVRWSSSGGRRRTESPDSRSPAERRGAKAEANPACWRPGCPTSSDEPRVAGRRGPNREADSASAEPSRRQKPIRPA